MTSGDDGSERSGRDRVIVRVSVVVIVLAVLVLAFYAGGRVARSSRSTAPLPKQSTTRPTVVSATPTPSTTPTTGPVAAGEHTWQALRGGECLDPYISEWQATYVVVACSAAHPAQMVHRVAISGDSYPGADSLIASLSLTCSGSDAIDSSRAAKYSDLRIVFSYPTEADWAAGIHAGDCFVTRAGGKLLTGSLAG